MNSNQIDDTTTNADSEAHINVDSESAMQSGVYNLVEINPVATMRGKIEDFLAFTQ